MISNRLHQVRRTQLSKNQTLVVSHPPLPRSKSKIKSIQNLNKSSNNYPSKSKFKIILLITSSPPRQKQTDFRIDPFLESKTLTRRTKLQKKTSKVKKTITTVAITIQKLRRLIITMTKTTHLLIICLSSSKRRETHSRTIVASDHLMKSSTRNS